MEISCNLSIEYEDSKKAKKILQSIKVDDFDFVKSQIQGNSLKADIKSKSDSSLIHTLDDYLSCVSVAEKIVNND